jgi:hopanoid biosynthesis associated RND transporter like protein HpnN
VALALGIAAAGLLPSARFDFNPVSLKDPTTESVATFLELMADADTAPYTIQVLAPSLDAANKLSNRLEALDEVDHTLSLANFIPTGQEDKLAVIEDIGLFMMPIMQQGVATGEPRADRDKALASFQKAIAASRHGELRPRLDRLAGSLSSFSGNPKKLLSLEKSLLHFLPARLDSLRLALEAGEVGQSDLPDDLRARFLSPGGALRIQVFPSENINDNKALRRFVAAVRRIAPRATDNPVEIIEAGDVVVSAIRNAAFIALAAIFALLIIVLRSLRDAMLVILPLALAALLTVAASVLLGMSFNFANVIVLPLLAGLGVASGIHLVARAREPARAAALMQTSTPRAVILSALTTIGSFGSLAVSSHRGTASMGELLTIAIAFTLICTLIVLPALMSWMNGESRPA